MKENDDPVDSLELVDCRSFSRGGYISDKQEVCREEVVVISLNGRAVTTQVATPDHLDELGAGFVISQGLATKVDDVRVDGLTVNVSASQRNETVHSFIESCGGTAGDMLVSRVESRLTIEKDLVFTVISAIVSELWERTGGAHCSVLFSNGALVAKRSDIGRHNTVDKIIGYALLNGIDLSDCILGCTGRQPLGMVTKAANAGIPIVISKAATTAKGVEQAIKAGITLICRVRQDSFAVYSHPWRIAGLEP